METTFRASVTITRRKGCRGKHFRTWVSATPISRGGFDKASEALDWAQARVTNLHDIRASVSLMEIGPDGRIVSEDRDLWTLDNRRMDA
jgi:hypothetical protein